MERGHGLTEMDKACGAHVRAEHRTCVNGAVGVLRELGLSERRPLADVPRKLCVGGRARGGRGRRGRRWLGLDLGMLEGADGLGGGEDKCGAAAAGAVGAGVGSGGGYDGLAVIEVDGWRWG